MKKPPARYVLIILLGVEAALFALYQLTNPGIPTLRLTWPWAAALFVGGLAIYAWSIRCPVPTCGKRQVFRGGSIFNLHWPGDRCYACGAKLKQASHDT